jgi:Sigma-70 region 2
MGSGADAEDMLQDVWLRVHHVRHTYRPSEPLLPWVYAIARRVRVDNYRKRQRIASREIAAVVLPEAPTQKNEVKTDLPSFEDLVASLPEPTRGIDDAESKRTEAGRGGSRYLFDGRSGEAKGASRLSPVAQFARTAAVCASGTQRSGEMTCHDIDNLISSKPGSALPAPEAAAHLDTCDECRL